MMDENLVKRYMAASDDYDSDKEGIDYVLSFMDDESNEDVKKDVDKDKI